MMVFVTWGAWTLLASAALMILVLATRAPLRRWFGPRLAYYLWLLPLARMILPPLPLFGASTLLADQASGLGAKILFIGPKGALNTALGQGLPNIGTILFALWLAGAIAVLALHAIRHFVFCSRLRRDGSLIGTVGRARVLAADVEGPLSFSVLRPFIVVPRGFAQEYSTEERDLVLAHENAHLLRGDLVANWVSLVVLAAHWWNPVAWLAMRAFHEDQEFAVDAHVLAARTPSALPLYAQVLAKAAGVGALPACSLNAQSNLKGRLMILKQKPRAARQILFGGIALALLGTAALAVTAPGTSGTGTGKQAVSIGVKPDGSGSFMLIVAGEAIRPGAPLPGGMTLPSDFPPAGGCNLSRSATPIAMAIKGGSGVQSYTVMCASAAPAPIRTTLAEGLNSLRVMRASVVVQPASPAFPESERAYALGVIDTSIREVSATLGASN